MADDGGKEARLNYRNPEAVWFTAAGTLQLGPRMGSAIDVDVRPFLLKLALYDHRASSALLSIPAFKASTRYGG